MEKYSEGADLQQPPISPEVEERNRQIIARSAQNDARLHAQNRQIEERRRRVDEARELKEKGIEPRR